MKLYMTGSEVAVPPDVVLLIIMFEVDILNSRFVADETDDPPITPFTIAYCAW